MDRTYYFIGIAFFGMINGLFNQLWLLFALIYTQQLAGPAVLRQRAADADVRLADGFDGHSHPGRHSGGHLRARQGVEGDSTEVSLWIWLAGTAMLTLPAVGNFLQIGL